MAGIPADALPRLQTWWARVEADTQAIFEAMYMEAPALVSRAVSGGAWLADGPEPGLAAQLGTDSDAAQAAADQIPRLDSAAPEITPYHAQVGQHVTIKWTEQNVSQAPLGAYFTDVYVTDPSEAQVGGARLEGVGLPAGGSVERTWDFPGGETTGDYQVRIFMNSEGADPHSGVPGPQGYRATTGGVFGVGRSEVTAGMQDMMVWNSATAAFRAAEAAANMGGLDREQTVIEQLRAGVNWLAAVDGLTAEEQKLAEHLAWRVEGIAYEVESSGVTDTLWASLAELATAVDAAPFGSDQENRKPVFDALKELTNSP